MEIRNIVTGESHELLVSGRIDGAGANQLEEEVLKAIRAEAKTIYINLSGATFSTFRGSACAAAILAPDEELGALSAGKPAIPRGGFRSIDFRLSRAHC